MEKQLLRSWPAVLLVCLVLALSTASCGRKNNPTESKSVRIGALLALTGSGANYGKSLKQGIELACEEINQAGGINGKPLEVIYEDSQGDAKTGVSAFNKLADIDHVPLVIGSISSVVLAVAPIADQKHVVLINSSAISPKICDAATQFLFSIMISGAQEASFMAQEAAKKHKGEPVAVLFSNNASGVDTKNRFVQDLTTAGGEVAIAESYELNSTDFRNQLAKIRESGAQLGYLIAFSSSEFARILIQTKEMNVPILWYSYSGFETKETLQLAGLAAEGAIYSYPDYSAQKDKMESFQQRYQNKYGSWADIYTVTSYDGVHLLASVIAANGSSADQIQTGLRKDQGYAGVFGDLHFEAKQCVTKPLIWKTVHGGAYSVLTP